MIFKFYEGYDIAVQAKGNTALRNGSPVGSVALLGQDCPDVQPDLRVKEGERVQAGQPIFVDRKRPEISFAAPAGGVVSKILLGHRRRLDILQIETEGNDHAVFPLPPDPESAADLRALLLRSGTWPAFLTRPFGRIPDPDATADAIFVTATDTNPWAFDMSDVIESEQEAMARGLAALALISGGPVFFCQPSGPALVDQIAGVSVVTFGGPHPSGLPGTHVNHLMPVSRNRCIWQIGWQDVAGIGHLLQTGQCRTRRYVSLGGPGAVNPGVIQTRSGALLDDLLSNEKKGDVRAISGSVLSGRVSPNLGRYHQQITILPRTGPMPELRPFWARLLGKLSGQHDPDSPIIPLESFERAMPLNILPTPLMRALAVGDTETAEQLGCLELLEEDMALLSYLCPGQADFAALLRQTLNELEGMHA